MRQLQRTQAGFTIVELMIATTVLSVILLMATFVMVNIGALYNKGIAQSNIQDSARTIIDDVAQNLELSNGYTGPLAGASVGQQVYCIGNTRYTMIQNKQIGTDISHVLWRDNLAGGSCSTTGVDLRNDPASTVSGAYEMVTSRSQLTKFSITGSGPYTITVEEVYGDSDQYTTDTSGNVICKGQKGDQYCAVAQLTTTVAPRLH